MGSAYIGEDIGDADLDTYVQDEVQRRRLKGCAEEMLALDTRRGEADGLSKHLPCVPY